jgi:ubiquitin carboxyl-terminal hydrolase 48
MFKKRNGASAQRRAKIQSPSFNEDTLWNWVLSEASSPSQVTEHHTLSTCGFASRNARQKPICANQYDQAQFKALSSDSRNASRLKDHNTVRHDDEDSLLSINDEADSATASCSKRTCQSNPNCLNYLGQAELVNVGTSIGQRFSIIRLIEASFQNRVGSIV